MKSFFEKINGLKEKLKLNRKYKMERFIAASLVFGVLMTFCIGSIVYTKVNKDRLKLAQESVYTKDFTMSLSGTNGEVVDVFRSSDFKKVFVLLHFDSMSQLSTDANFYRLFLTTKSTIKQHKAIERDLGSIFYVFGSTGYAGIYLVDSEGFDKKLYDLILRHNRALTESSDEKSTFNEHESFMRYDQARIYFNPTGSEGSIAKFLDEGNNNIFDIYEETVTKRAEKEIREKLNKSLSQMQLDLALIKEYTERVERLGVIVDDVPKEIAGDTVKAYYNGELLTLNEDEHYVNQSGEIVDFNDINFVINSKFTLVGGYDFDWQNGSISKGYLKDLVPNGLSYGAFFKKKLSERTSHFDTSNITWKYRDGGTVDRASHSGLTTVDKEILENISLLESAWSKYYMHKSTYQYDYLQELLYLESNAREADRNYTYSDRSSLLTTY